MRRFSYPAFLFALTGLAYGQPLCRVSHLAIFDANVAEFTEQRTLDLQPGINSVEWRSLMPKAHVRTIHATGDGITVLRQDVTYDGPEVGNEESPVLHLTLQNAGAAGPHKVQVDYLAPNLSWKGDYSMVLGPSAAGNPPTEVSLDGWVTVQNDTGTDVCAGSLDLVAGEIRFLLDNGGKPRAHQATQNSLNRASIQQEDDAETGDTFAEVTGVSIFSRLRLAKDVSMTANATIDRFPLFQRLKLPIEERHIFENAAHIQTFARGGFILQPRGLEVRLVGTNRSRSPLPAGTVTVYTMDGEVPQVVGQDSIPLTPVGGTFTVSQGLSGVLQGTRRIADHRQFPNPDDTDERVLIDSIEVVISNRGPVAATVFVREGVEESPGKAWTVTKSSHPYRKLGDHQLEFEISVPSAGSVKIEYTVQTK